MSGSSRNPEDNLNQILFHEDKTKRNYRRVVYSNHQKHELENEFNYDQYITHTRKAELAISLGLSERQVQIWFQNRRAKERKQVKERAEEETKFNERLQQLDML